MFEIGIYNLSINLYFIFQTFNFFSVTEQNKVYKFLHSFLGLPIFL